MLYFIICIFMLISHANAGFVLHRVSSITEFETIVSKLHSADTPVKTIYDFDDTLIKSRTEARDGEETFAALERMDAKGIERLIMTARLQGYNPKLEAFPFFLSGIPVAKTKTVWDAYIAEEIADQRETILGKVYSGRKLPFSDAKSPFKPDLRNSSFITSAEHAATVSGSIVFAGPEPEVRGAGFNKALALKQLIDRKYFINPPKTKWTFAFLDDKESNVIGMREIFGKDPNVTVHGFVLINKPAEAVKFSPSIASPLDEGDGEE